MNLRTGNMWEVYAEVDLFLITTNSYVTGGGKLVMGRGIALQARQKWPGLDQRLGSLITASYGHLGQYGLLISPAWPDQKLGLFQVKTDYRNAADLDLIAFSVAGLLDWCHEHPRARVALNYPGVGNGRREHAEVLPLITGLPDTVDIWELAEHPTNYLDWPT